MEKMVQYTLQDTKGMLAKKTFFSSDIMAHYALQRKC